MFGKYFKNVLIGFDQLGNALLGGDPDETISSRTGKVVSNWKTPRKWTIAYWLDKFLCLFEKNHSVRSIEEDEGKDKVI